ncbi:carbohydrate ABC transporter permease [Microbacterium panaciterrae]|uniref:Carbohydrate ABC transporter permease n=1 Tax=Microbacterium panaciterrae TaxID=985759 RepID=A0ABP8PU69_9MICO
MTQAIASPASRFSDRTRKPDTDGQRASVFTYIFIVIAIALFGLPFLYIVLTSIASTGQISQGTSGLFALSPQWSNFVEAFTRVDFPKYTLNSLLLASITSVLTTASSATIGFAFARLRGRGRNVLFGVLLATMMVPAVATLIPTYVIFARIGLVGTYWPWVLWGLAGTPYFIFLFRQFFTSIPMELEDAAIIDGCGWWRIYALVFLPLSRPMILTAFLLSFTWSWGDFLAPKLLLSIDNTTLAVAMSTGYLDPMGNPLVNIQAAGALLYLLPVVVIFFVAQRYFMGSSLGSAVKG